MMRNDGRVLAAAFAEVAVEVQRPHRANDGQPCGTAVEAGVGAADGDVAGAVHSFASGAPPSICARTSGIGGPP